MTTIKSVSSFRVLEVIMDRTILKGKAKNLVFKNFGIFAILTLFNILATYCYIMASYNIFIVLCWSVVISFTSVMLAKANIHASRQKSMKLRHLMSDLGAPTIKQFLATSLLTMVNFVANEIAYVFLQLIKGNLSLSALPVIAIIVIVVLTVMVAYIQIRLSFVQFIATDERFDDLGVMNTIKISWNISRKEVLNIIVLNLSFGWWYLGTILTMGMLSIFAVPYINQTLEQYYEGLLLKNM